MMPMNIIRHAQIREGVSHATTALARAAREW